MKSENLIHIKLGYDEALEAKKEVLSIEANLIRTAQCVNKYRELRLKELDLKIDLNEKIGLLKEELRKLRSKMPKIQIPKIVKEFQEKKLAEEKKKKAEFHKEIKHIEIKEKKIKEKPKEPKKIEKPKDDLESQLQEIQEKLSRLH